MVITRVLFFEEHPMWIHGLPNGFRDAGHEVKVSGILNEENICMLIENFRPDLIAMMGWTEEHTPEKLNWIRKHVKRSGVPLIYWATEDPAYTHCFSLPLIQQIIPDFIFTISSDRVDYYKKLGMKAAHLTFAYHDSIHCRVPVESKYKVDIAVVANGYYDYIKSHPECMRNMSLKALIYPLLKEKIRVDFWGRYWDKMGSVIGVDIPKDWIHGYLPYTEANKVYSSAQIVIGLQNKQLSQRTYEILGSEGFLLSYDNLAVRQLFKTGCNVSNTVKENSQTGYDFITSSSAEETIELVKYYLNHPEECEKIRKQGKEAVAEHTYKHRAEYVVDMLMKNCILKDGVRRKE